MEEQVKQEPEVVFEWIGMVSEEEILRRRKQAEQDALDALNNQQE